MGFIQSLLGGFKRKKQEKNDACDTLIKKIDIAIADINTLFYDKQNFIEPQQAGSWSAQHKILFDEISVQNIRGLKGAVQYKNLIKRKDMFLEVFRLCHKEFNNTIMMWQITGYLGLTN